MSQAVQNLAPHSVAVTISLPTSAGAGSRITTLLKNGTLLTAAGDQPACLTSLADDTARLAFIAAHAMLIIISNHTASIKVGFIAAMTGATTVTTGTDYVSDPASDAPRRTYLGNSAASAQSVTARVMFFPYATTSDGT